MKKTPVLLLCLGAAVLSLGGCATRVVVREPVPPPPVVVVDPVDIDYWYDDGSGIYYYYDYDLGLYFWWNAGFRVYCGRGWVPIERWHHHDGFWRDHDRYYREHRDEHPGRFPDGHRGPGREPGRGEPGRHEPDRGHGPDRGHAPDRGHHDG